MEGVSPIGWLCLLPPVLTIGWAIATRRVVPSLLAGIAAAVLIMLPTPAAYELASGVEFSWYGYLSAMLSQFLVALTEGHLWASFADSDHLRVFAFTTILSIQVALIHRSGGMLGIVRWAAPLAKTRRGGQVLTWLLGLVIFIDDYANTLLLGSTMRPVADRLKISREKLAFLVDSTAAPVTGLALVSTWVATEISYMQAGFEDAGIAIGNNTFGIFLATIPTRFYILYALIFVIACGLCCRDFGPMLRAEQAAADGKSNLPPEPKLKADSVPRPWNAVLPIVVTVAVAVWLLVLTGQAEIGDSPLPDSLLQAWGQIIGNGNSYVALVYGSIAGLVVILGQVAWQRSLTSTDVRAASIDGFVHVLPALVILWLAWTLSNLTGKEHMQTGVYLASVVNAIDVWAGFMPTIVFLLASVIAFSTGTSWGTMGILMPIVIPVVYEMLRQQTGTAPDAAAPILTASIGSVLAGAIFGDHCSPISDTTILSSRSSGCDHIAHVRTQMPYALTIASVAVVFGTLPTGFGVSSWILLPLGTLAMIAILLIFGRRADAPA